MTVLSIIYMYVWLTENLWFGIGDIRYHTRRMLSLTRGTIGSMSMCVCIFRCVRVDITIIMCHHHHHVPSPSSCVINTIMCHHHHVSSSSCVITIMCHYHHHGYGMRWGEMIIIIIVIIYVKNQTEWIYINLLLSICFSPSVYK